MYQYSYLDSEEREYEERRARDPPAPTAIPAMEPPSSHGGVQQDQVPKPPY